MRVSGLLHYGLQLPDLAQGQGLLYTLGSNLFPYMRDPWGSWIEYFTDMDQISENWQGRD